MRRSDASSRSHIGLFWLVSVAPITVFQLVPFGLRRLSSLQARDDRDGQFPSQGLAPCRSIFCSAPPRTLSLARIMRMTDDEARETPKARRPSSAAKTKFYQPISSFGCSRYSNDKIATFTS
jgi:hypothetical protein